MGNDQIMARTTRSLRLYRKAESALIAAIEIYNKPNFTYREETFAILAINAWELLLKAKVLAENDNRLQALYVREHRTKVDGTRTAHTFLKRNRVGNVHTIGMGAAIASLEASPTTRLPSEVRGNLEALTEVRDNAVHYVNASFELAKYVLEIGTACVRNFIALADKWFDEDLAKYSLYLMPIGFLSAPAGTAIVVGGNEGKLVSYLRNLVAAQNVTTTSGSGYHIALDLNLSFKRSTTDAISTFALTNDPSAPHVYLTEEDIRARYPWDYRELLKRCRARYSDFKENNDFHKIRRPLLEDTRFVKERFLDPGNPKSSKKPFHNPNILAELDKHYTRKP
jgi:hypothetical protein